MVAWMCKGSRADPLDFEVGEVDHDPETLNLNLSIQQGEGFPFSVYEGGYVFFYLAVVSQGWNNRPISRTPRGLGRGLQGGC